MAYEDFIYDIETYPNIFTMWVICVDTGSEWLFEISDRKNDITPMLQLLWWMARTPGVRMVGYNNEGFDYPVIHLAMQQGEATTFTDLYVKAQQIIESDDRFDNIVRDKDRFIEQVDLYKIHHFDNRAKSTSLKMIEYNMQSENIQDLPFPPGTVLDDRQKDHLIYYNRHDDLETLKFYRFSLDAIRFREELSRRYDRNFINFNDTKIGKEYFIMRLEAAAPGCCYDYSTGRRELHQTPRSSIHLGGIIFPYVRFEHPALQSFQNWLGQQTITQTKGAFDDLSVEVNGFTFDFGLGGIHGSIDSSIVKSNDTHVIIDLDVTSYYPSIAIVNRIYPEHLGETFCDIYGNLKTERIKHDKKSAINAALKLALNGTFGDSNSIYSPFYDPKFTMGITVNGQLMLCMLSEQLMKTRGLRMVQANTDGVTVYCPRNCIETLRSIAQWWENLTGLELGENIYQRMFIRDVNNYIAEDIDGNIKRKGAYAYETPLENPKTRELEWHKNHSCRVVQKAAESALLDGEDIATYIRNHPDPFDFMLRTKVPRNSKLLWGDEQVQNITRYYISYDGRPLRKVMPPVSGKEWHILQVYRLNDGTELTARTKTEIKSVESKVRRFGGEYVGDRRVKAPDRVSDVNKGFLTTPCNDLGGMTTFNFNYDWYIAEAKKLVDPLQPFKI